LKISFASSKKEQFELCSKEILGDYLTDGSSKQEELKLWKSKLKYLSKIDPSSTKALELKNGDHELQSQRNAEETFKK